MHFIRKLPAIEMKKTLWIVLLIAITFYSYAQDATDYASFYITGYDVNLRTTPDLKSKVCGQANWGDRYLAKRYNKNWLQAYAWDDSQILYIHADYINDFEGILSDEQEKELTDLIKKHEQQTTDQIVIVTLTTLKPYENIEAYSLDLANEWGVGHKNKNNGVLIALGIGLRKIRIQNGYGIEKRLTDTETKKIIDEIITPAFRAGNYYEGLSRGLKAIIEELK